MVVPGDGDTGVVVPVTVTVSPYTLASSDNPGALISPIILNGWNYNIWFMEMMNALQAKRKTSFVNRTLKKLSTDDPNYENWQVVNSMIVGWICASIEPKVKSTVSFIYDAYLLWTDLKQRFSVGNIVRVHQLKSQIASCRQNGRSVIEYYGELCSLWEELKMYRLLLHCVCDAKTEMCKEKEEEKLHQFVMGLDDSRFGNLCTTIIGMDLLPSLGDAYSRVIREEQILMFVINREQQQSEVGFATRGSACFKLETGGFVKQDNSIFKNRNTTCTNCGRTGHEKRECWHIIGFPDLWTDRAAGSEKQNRGKASGRDCGCGNGGQGRNLMTEATAAHALP